MTEAEWLACDDPTVMLTYLRGKTTDRKLRLFGVGCCRRIESRLPEVCRHALDVAERFADGRASDNERKAARGSAMADRHAERFPSDVAPIGGGPKQAVAFVLARKATDNVPVAARTASHAAAAIAWNTKAAAQPGVILPAFGTAEGWTWMDTLRLPECSAQCDLLRDVIGNPFRSPCLDPACLAQNDPSLGRLASSIYEEGDFQRLRMLADGLEAAGCNNAALIQHCREQRQHVRGCWAVDVILGKE